jgi:hypothetical protein
MNESLRKRIRQLRLSGLAGALDVRLRNGANSSAMFPPPLPSSTDSCTTPRSSTSPGAVTDSRTAPPAILQWTNQPTDAINLPTEWLVLKCPVTIR